MRDPDPALMRLFPPLTRWSPETAGRLYATTILDREMPESQRRELAHLCEVWELASYGFRHRSVNGRCWVYARELVRQARSLQDAFYNGHDVLYAISCGRECFMLLKAEVEREAATAARRQKALRGAGKNGAWVSKIKAVIDANPALSNRELATLVECSEATIRRWRKRR